MRRLPMARLLIATALSLAAFGLAAGQASAAPLNCPSTFQIEHDDSIGKIKLSAGAYQIKVSDPAKLACASAAQDLAEFLSDYDGQLRRPWTVATGRPVFTRGLDSNTAFSLRRVGDRPSPANPVVPVVNPTSNACPGYFQLRHDDHIGALAIRKAQYRVTILDPQRFTCAAAFKEFARFLEDFDGKLTRPWNVNNNTATFRRGKSSTVGFRVKPAAGREPARSKGRQFPAKGQPGECPGTFQVFNSDRINSLQLRAGRYLTFVRRGSGLSCRRVSSLLHRFLSARGQVAPRPWKVDGGSGVFTNGRRPGFRVKPASPSGSTAAR